MPDDHAPRTAAKAPGFATRLSHAGRTGTKVRAFVNPPLYRGSTMLHLDVADRINGGKHPLERRSDASAVEGFRMRTAGVEHVVIARMPPQS